MTSVRVEMKWRGRRLRVPASDLAAGVAWVLRWRGSWWRKVGELGLDAVGKNVEGRIFA